MMDNRQYKRFKKIFAGTLLIFAGCSTASTGSATAQTPEPAASAAPSAFPRATHFQALITPSEAADGSLVMVSVTFPEGAKTETAPTAVYEGIQVSFYKKSETPKSYEAVMGVPFNHKPGATVLRIHHDGKELDLPLLVKDGNYPSETIQVSNRHVNPSKKDMKRIKKDIADVQKIYRRVTEAKYWDGPFSYPVDSAVTSVFGTKRVFNGEMRSFHGGLDLRAPTGTRILAPAGGEVVLSKFLFFTGNTVMIDHGYGVVTIYAHMSKLKAKVGTRVKKGTLLGLSGMTGRASGPHLHWQAVVHNTKINPMDLVKVLR